MVRDEMMQRNMVAVRAGFEAIQAGRFEAALRVVAPFARDGAGAVLHAIALAGSGEVRRGAAALAAVAAANPGARHPMLDLEEVLRRLGRGAEVLAHLRAAVELRPGDAAVWAGLGAALAERAPIGEAIAAIERAAALAPGVAGTWSNLGKALAAAGRFEAAAAASNRAMALAPGDAQVAVNHAVVLLKAGRWAEGWGLFRARHRLPGRAPGLPGVELQSLDGVAGRTVALVHDEGFGDGMQFIRYAPLLAARGARVTVMAPPPLQRLLTGWGLEVVGARSVYDAWVRIPDLPWLFGTTVETVPPPLPVGAARGRAGGRRVGVVWAGDPASPVDGTRSLDPAVLASLLGRSGVEWVSLQHGRPALPGMVDGMAGVRDLADTAAVVAGLDMVVSVDTAVAHLAATLGVPVMLLDRFDNCWRWLSGRVDSVWYPGVLRIVRQERPGDWVGVVTAARALLAGADGGLAGWGGGAVFDDALG